MAGEIVHNLVLKRKRSQRQRPPGALENSSSSSSEVEIKYGCPMTSSLSPGKLLLLREEEEEEDYEAANCLILLARGQHRAEFISPGTQKIEMASSSKAGVYECKTCNRSFHSFQALGGHRTSHKKQKIATEDSLLPKSASSIRPLPLENIRKAEKIRVHQCLICDAQFPSGQALGGHMRRHRVVDISVNAPSETPTNTIETITLSLPSHVEKEKTGNETSRGSNKFQCLDLNFPASSSSEDEICKTEFSFASEQNQQLKQLQDSSSLFTSPASVDCHY